MGCAAVRQWDVVSNIKGIDRGKALADKK